MAGMIPAALRDLIDDAALFPPGNAPLEAAVPAHRGYRQSWYEPLVGPLLIPQTRLAALDPGRTGLRIAVIVDGDPATVLDAVEALGPQVTVAHYESRRPLDDLAKHLAGKPVYAEIPLEEDAIEAVRPTGFTPKFRTGGLTADLFPAPEALAAAMHACRRRGMRFKLTAGLHRAVRHRDPVTGFEHHGFVNVLVAADAAAENDPGATAAVLASEDAADLAARAKRLLGRPRALWTGFGSCSINEPLQDLLDLGLLHRGDAA